MLHLNNDSLKERLFPWLFDTMEKLISRVLLSQQKAEKDKTDDQMTFGGKPAKKPILTESEKLLNEFSDDSDDEASKASKKKLAAKNALLSST